MNNNEMDDFIHKVTEEYINDWDPMYLFNGCKKADYTQVVKRIVALIQERKEVSDFAQNIADIIEEEFDNDVFLLDSCECQHVVFAINKAISNYEYKEQKINLDNNGIIETFILTKKSKIMCTFLNLNFKIKSIARKD